jgi:putative membrane protein
MIGWFWVWPLLVLLGLVLLGYLAYEVAHNRVASGAPHSLRSAREILDERYARDEIGDEEYRARRAELQ